MGNPDIAKVLASVPTGLWIGGEERSGKSTFDVLNPATDEVLLTVANADASDALAALDAACAVQAEWAATPGARARGDPEGGVRDDHRPRRRRRDPDDAGDGQGRRREYGRGQVRAEFFRWFAEEAVRIHGRFTHAPAGTGRIVVTKQPVGPCYAITPWNFPWRWAPARSGPRWRPVAR